VRHRSGTRTRRQSSHLKSKACSVEQLPGGNGRPTCWCTTKVQRAVPDRGEDARREAEYAAKIVARRMIGPVHVAFDNVDALIILAHYRSKGYV